MMTLREILTSEQDCNRCHLRKDCNQVVPGYGPASKLMLVGEAPGENEDLLGEPFVGLAGELLSKMLKEAGINRKACFITNSVRCRPTTKNGRWVKNRPPTDDEIQSCKDWLWKEIQVIQPSVIVTFGKVPTRLLLRLKKTFRMADYFGKHLTVDYSDAIIIPCWHPSYLLQHGKDKLEDSINLLKSVKQIIQESK